MRKHVNPAGYWTHEGAYSIEFLIGRGSIWPQGMPLKEKGVAVDGNVLHVSRGPERRVCQSMGGIDFHFGNGIIRNWGYVFIGRIRNGRGKLLWQNKNYKAA